MFLIKRILFCILIFLSAIYNLTAHEAPDVWDVVRSQFSLNHEVSRSEVQEQLKWLTAHPGYLNSVSRQAEPYIYHVLAQIRKRKLPGELVLIPMIESAYNPFAYSGVGAAGLWQLMPKTGRELGLRQDWWFDGRRSICPSTNAALNYLVYLNKIFNRNWILAIASYDAGEGTIARSIKANVIPGKAVDFWSLPIPQETKIYIPRLLALAEIIKNPGLYQVSLPNIPYLPYFEEVNVGSQIDLDRAAKLAGMSYKELIKLNPGFNHWTTAPYKPFNLLIPTEKVERFSFNLANFPEEKRVSWTKHLILQGDSLNSIANRYHTTVNLLKQLNQLKSNWVTPNQYLLIPNSKNLAIIVNKEPPSPITPHVNNLLITARNHRIIHIVQKNDTIASIQKIYGVSLVEIKSWNNLTTPIVNGQQLVIWKKINQATPYIVKAGENLALIARNHHTKLNTLLELNPGLDINKPLHAGNTILIS